MKPTHQKLVSFILCTAFAFSALLPTAAQAAGAAEQANQPVKLAFFESISSWFSQWRTPIVTPTPSITHQQNVLNRLQDRFEEMQKTATQLSGQVKDLNIKGYDTTKIEDIVEIAAEKVTQAGLDIGVATSTIVTVPESEQLTDDDVRISLINANESVRTATSAVTQAKTRVRDFIRNKR